MNRHRVCLRYRRRRAAFALVALLIAEPVMATDRYVASNGVAPNDGSKWSWAYTNVQDALNACANGDTIYVAGHTFVLTNQLVWAARTNVAIRGGYAATNDLDQPGPYSATGWPTVLTRAAAYSNRIMLVTNVYTGTLERVTITGGCPTNTASFGGGLCMVGSPGLLISGCIISNNAALIVNGGGGGLAAFSSTVTLSNCLVKGNSGKTYGNGICLPSGGGATVTLVDSIVAENRNVCSYGGGICNYGTLNMRNCLIVGNSTMGGQGDGIRNGGTLLMGNCTVAYNTGSGIYGASTVSNSIFWGNGDDFTTAPTLRASNVEDGDGNGVNGNISADPLFVGGYYLAENSPCVDAGTNTAAANGLTNRTTRLDGSNDSDRVDMGYHYPTGYDQSMLDVYVATNGDNGYSGTNWSQAFRTISKALSVARDGTRVHIGAGSYTNGSESFPLTVANLVGVQLLGESRTTTVINATGSSNQVLTLTNVPGVVLSKLMFTGGSLTNAGFGGGIGLILCGGAVISDCAITNNTTAPVSANTSAYGGGISVRHGAIDLVDSLFDRNTASASGSGVGHGGAIHMGGSVMAVRNCTLQNNICASGAGIGYGGAIDIDYTVAGNVLTLYGSTLANNQAKSYGGAIYMGSVACLLSNCLVTGNTCPGSDGFYGGSGLTLVNCTLAYNSGVGIRGSGTLRYSILWGNGDDLLSTGWTVSYTDIEDGDYSGVNGCFSEDPKFEPGYYLATDSPCVDRGTNTAAECGLTNSTTRLDGVKDSGLVDLGFHHREGIAQGSIITDLYVAPGGDDHNSGTNDWDAFRTIGKAFTVAQDGTRVHIAAGSYTNGLEAFPLTLANLTGVQILGANRALTVIDASGSSNRVLTVTNSPGAVLSELTITGGYQTNSTSGFGGGIALWSSGGASLSGCVISNNTLAPVAGSAYGGGIYAKNSAITLSDCVVITNIATCASGSSLGGGIYTEASPLVLRETIVARNRCVNGICYGGGVYIASGASAMRNCLVVENSATSLGGGIQPYDALTLENCTVANNGAQGIRTSTTLIITNSIIWGHTDDIWGSSVTLGYSDIGNGDSYGVNGCISNNPAFANTNALDYRLTRGSPCVNTGTNLAWSASGTDLDGNKRRLSDRVDMGAYEMGSVAGMVFTLF